jgi:hypothetical protein
VSNRYNSGDRVPRIGFQLSHTALPEPRTLTSNHSPLTTHQLWTGN